MSTTGEGGAPLGTAAAPAVRTITPEEYDRLQSEFDSFKSTSAAQRALLERLSPFADDIEWMVEDQGAIDAVRRTRQALKAMKESEAPVIDPNIKPLYDKVSRLDEFVTGLEKQQQEAAERPAKEQAAKYESWKNDPANEAFFKKIAAQYTDQLQGPQIRYLAELAAANDFMPLEQVWNKGGCRIVGATPPQEVAPPPSSLTLGASAGEAGAAPPAGTPAGGTGPTMRDRIIELERRRRGISA